MVIPGKLRIVCCLLLLCCISNPSQAQTSKAYIKMALDSSEIFLGDTVVLDVDSTGLLDPIDLTPLEEHATLVRETIGTRIAVINGKVVEIAIRRMDLIPKKSGLLVMGPLIAGSVVSNSVHINVLNSTRPTWQPLQEDLQITTSLDPASPSVNQQTVLSIELLHRYPISNESISLPSLTGFSKRLIIDKRRTFKGDDKEWYRTEWRYLLFPTHSGDQAIGAINWSGTLAKSRVERSDFSRTHDSLKITVKPGTSDSGTWWLPSSGLTLSESWSSPVTGLRAGDELQRTISVRATGVLAGQIPTPNVPQSRALQQSLINTTRDETINGNTIVSTAEFTYRVKAQSPIPVFLDTVRIPWWNTTTEESKEAIIPARRINVGLPDRADLLSQIALQETGATRMMHWMLSNGWLRSGIFLAAAVSAATLAWALIPAILNRLTHRRRRKLHLRTMRKLAKRGDAVELYRLLNQKSSRDLLAGADKDLINQLEQHLFSVNVKSVSPKNLPLKELVKELGRNRIQVQPKPRLVNNTALADL